MYFFCFCYFILKMVRVLVFVLKNRPALKCLFSCVPSTVPYCIVDHVKPAVNSGVLEQWDETGYVVLLKQCCILISNLPSAFVFSQKDELSSICKLYLFFFSKRWTKGLIGLILFHFLTLYTSKSLTMSAVSVCLLGRCAPFV